MYCTIPHPLPPGSRGQRFARRRSHQPMLFLMRISFWTEEQNCFKHSDHHGHRTTTKQSLLILRGPLPERAGAAQLPLRLNTPLWRACRIAKAMLDFRHLVSFLMLFLTRTKERFQSNHGTSPGSLQPGFPEHPCTCTYVHTPYSVDILETQSLGRKWLVVPNHRQCSQAR